MEADSVRLTVQLRDANNNIRLTTHADVLVSDLTARAGDIAGRMATFYAKEKRALKYGVKSAASKG
jgi:hypothetical protein